MKLDEAEVYRKAVELIRKRGWFGDFKPPKGSLCLGLAVGEAAFELKSINGVSYSTRNDHLPHIHDVVGDNMIQFNDSSTKEDVLAALEIAADLATPTP